MHLYYILRSILASCLAIQSGLGFIIDSNSSTSSTTRAEQKESTSGQEKYMVYPKNGTNAATIASIEVAMKKIFQAEQFQSVTYHEKVLFWIVYTKSDQVEELKTHKDILGVAADIPASLEENHVVRLYQSGSGSFAGQLGIANSCHDTQQVGKRDEWEWDLSEKYMSQPYAPVELVQISLPMDTDLDPNWEDYIYEKEAGEGIYIYQSTMVSTYYLWCNYLT